MKINSGLLALLSLAGGTVLMAITSLFGAECKLAPPGGMSPGWKGLPIPYSECGVWGEFFSWPIAALDFVILTLISYLLLKFVIKVIDRRRSSVLKKK